MTEPTVPAPAPGVSRIRKRDGRVVAFEVSKIEHAVAAALEASGEADAEFAREVAGLVELTLSQGRRALTPEGDVSDTVPGIEEIQDLVERALMELGRPQVAKAYILYRDRRARIRRALRVHRSGHPSAPVRVRETEGISAWSKGRLVAALIEEAELPRAAAEEVASAVEGRVLGSGCSRITTGLIRELVAGALLERGWTHALGSLAVIGLARHDLRRAFEGEPLSAWEERHDAGGAVALRDVGQRVAGEVLRRFALEEVLPEGVGELHRAGDLHVEDLGAPERALGLCVDASLLASGGHSVTSAQAVLEGAADLARQVSRVLVLERPGEVLAPLLRAARPSSPLGLTGWLRALSSVARAAGIRIDLGAPGARFASFTARLIEGLAELIPGPHAPVLYLEGHELESLLAAHPDLAVVVDRLMGEARLVSTWEEDGEVFAGPGCVRRRREPGILSCAGAIALNLPRLARRAGPWREDVVLAGVAELVQASVEAAASLDAFQRGQRGNESRAGGALHLRRAWAVVPVGLREALLHLGEGSIDANLGARLLGLVAEAATRFSPNASQPVTLCAPSPFFGERAARRFAWLDGRRARESGGEQRWLFDDAEEGQGAPSPAYTHDLRLSPVAGTAAGRLEAEAFRTLPVGALPLEALPSAGGEDTPYLAAWRRFEVLRRAGVGEVVLELFPSRPFPGPGAVSGGTAAATESVRPAATLRPLP